MTDSTDYVIAFGSNSTDICCLLLLTDESSGETIFAAIPFEEKIKTKNILSLKVTFMELRSFLSGDIKFISTVIGNQGSS